MKATDLPFDIAEARRQNKKLAATSLAGLWLSSALDEIARLTSHNMMLVKALEPFEHQARIIEAADAKENVKPETFELFRFRGSYCAICYGDCVRARLALEGRL